MKTSYLSLTFLIAFLPTVMPTFNIFNVGGENETLLESNCIIDQCGHTHHLACPFEASDLTDKNQLKFGAELGQFIRSTQIKDSNYRIQKVVIDPGHGGKDPGCSGKGTREKEIALSLSLQLGRTLQAYFPGIQFIFTRQTDVFVPLNQRAKIANDHKADLFISIHCNNFPKSSNPKGSETYVLGLHRAKDNLEVAKRENAAIYYEDNYQQAYDGYDPNSTEGHIILSMFQNAFLEQSILFANKVEKNIKQNTQHKSRGVRQAGFLVLRKTTMPSVLVEAGYLSNPKDNKFLATANGQAQIVNAIAQAFVEYKKEVEGGSSTISPDVYASTVNTSSRTAAIPPKKSNTSKRLVPKPKAKVQTIKPETQVAKSGSQALSKQSLIIPKYKNNATEPTHSTNKVHSNQSDIQYRVLLSSSVNLINTDKEPWNTLPYTVQVIKDGNNFKYMAVGFNSFEEAVTAKSKLRKTGFKEAFLVAYQNGKRIDMKEAMSKTGR